MKSQESIENFDNISIYRTNTKVMVIMHFKIKNLFMVTIIVFATIFVTANSFDENNLFLRIAEAGDDDDGGDGGNSDEKDSDEKDSDDDSNTGTISTAENGDNSMGETSKNDKDKESNTGTISVATKSTTDDTSIKNVKEINDKTKNKFEKLTNNIVPINDKTKEIGKEKVEVLSIPSQTLEAGKEGTPATATKLAKLVETKVGNEDKKFSVAVGGLAGKIGKEISPVIKPFPKPINSLPKPVKPLPGIAGDIVKPLPGIAGDIVKPFPLPGKTLPIPGSSSTGPIVCFAPPCPNSNSNNEKNNNGMETSDKKRDTKSSSSGGYEAESVGSDNAETSLPAPTEDEELTCANEFAVPVVSLLIAGCITPPDAVATDLSTFEGNATVSFMGMELPNVAVSDNMFAASLPDFIPVDYLSSDPVGISILENIQNSTNIGLEKITNVHMSFAVDSNTHESYNELTYCYKETVDTEELCGTETYVSEA